MNDKKEEGLKFDDGKLRFDLLPPEALEELVKVYTISLAKYPENNWRRGIKWGRIFGGTMRHLWAFWRGEEKDKESGVHHLAHAAWGCFTLFSYIKTHQNLDDRIKTTDSKDE